jgi:hypothetical protein
VTSQVAVTLARAAQWKDAVAIGGAALLVLGYFSSASWDSAWGFAKRVDDIWAIWSPLEALGAALLVAFAVLASRRGRLARESADGVLLGVGLIVLVAMIAFVWSVFEFDGAAALTGGGAVVIAAAGALGVLTRRAPEIEWPRQARVSAIAGAALAASPLVVNVAEWSSSGLLEEWPRSYYLEALAGAAAAILSLLVLLRVPRARLPVAGGLVAVGLLLSLHYVGLMIQIAKYEGVDALRFGGALGVAGGLVLVRAGMLVLRDKYRAEAPATASGVRPAETAR